MTQRRYRERGAARQRTTLYLPIDVMARVDHLVSETETSRSAVVETLLQSVLRGSGKAGP